MQLVFWSSDPGTIHAQDANNRQRTTTGCLQQGKEGKPTHFPRVAYVQLLGFCLALPCLHCIALPTAIPHLIQGYCYPIHSYSTTLITFRHPCRLVSAVMIVRDNLTARQTLCLPPKVSTPTWALLCDAGLLTERSTSVQPWPCCVCIRQRQEAAGP